jgi:hypothetical protein
MYSSEQAAWQLQQLRDRLPTDLVVYARDLFNDPTDWRRRWPVLVRVIDALVFFTDHAGFIGRGVYDEISDARAANKPVHFFSDAGTLYQLSAIRISVVNGGRDWQRYARVRLATAMGVS